MYIHSIYTHCISIHDVLSCVTLAGHHSTEKWSYNVILWTVPLAPCASFWSAAQYLLVVWSCDVQWMIRRMKCHSPDKLHYSWLWILTFLQFPAPSFIYHISYHKIHHLCHLPRPDSDVLQALCLGIFFDSAMWQLQNCFISESSVPIFFKAIKRDSDWLALCLPTRLIYSEC